MLETQTFKRRVGSAPVDGGLFGRADGGPVRLRRNGRQPKAVGLYFSAKAGRHLPYESKLELHDLWRAEVDADVVCSRPQPFTLRLVRGGVLTRYTPDRLDILADGARVVIEVKDRLSPEAVIAEFGEVVELLALRGLRFEVRQRVQIEAQPMLAGVEAVQRRRRTQFLQTDCARLTYALRHGATTFAELAGAMGPGPSGEALVCAAAVRRLVRIDLAHGLRADSAVERVR